MGTMLGWVDTEEELQVTCRLLRHSCRFLQALVGGSGFEPPTSCVCSISLNRCGSPNG